MAIANTVRYYNHIVVPMSDRFVGERVIELIKVITAVFDGGSAGLSK